MQEYLTPKEAAAKFKVSEQTIRNMWHAGTLKGIRIGKLIRIDPNSLGNTTPTPSRRKIKVKDYFADLK